MIRSEIRKTIEAAVKSTFGDIAVPDFSVAAPENSEHGDYATNVAMLLARVVKKNPMEIAEALVRQLTIDNIQLTTTVAVPGFINFRLPDEVLQKEFSEILKRQEKYGSGAKKKEKINLEFVSANPTGPLTMANGRGGFLGDVLANILEKVGYDVIREYYINDAGFQITKLGESIFKAQNRFPFDIVFEYKAEYVKELANKIKLNNLDGVKLAALIIKAKDKFDVAKKVYSGLDKENQIIGMRMLLDNPRDKKNYDDLCSKYGYIACDELVSLIRLSLKKAGIKHDVWFSEEQNLHKKKELQKALELLRKKGLVNKKDGAEWLDDNVVIKSDGQSTYFLADLAYHYDKFVKRKFDIAIDVWGADHHGYVARMKNGMQAFGIDSNRLHILITQFVRLVKDGEEVRMSKRAGEFITLDELLEEVGLDAARFFFLMHSPDTHMDFDLDLAKKHSMDNPVYYVQYAHVRCQSILAKSQITNNKSQIKPKIQILNTTEERALIKKLFQFPEVVEDTARDYQAHRLTRYATELAGEFHNFYEKHRVITEDEAINEARLALVVAVKIVLGSVLDLLGVSKPERM
ncbi:MAG: arginine--tRNA ligase [bacterium]|nr:arginine--tRNA ligase [bacterium]